MKVIEISLTCLKQLEIPQVRLSHLNPSTNTAVFTPLGVIVTTMNLFIQPDQDKTGLFRSKTNTRTSGLIFQGKENTPSRLISILRRLRVVKKLIWAVREKFFPRKNLGRGVLRLLFPRLALLTLF